MSSVSNMLSTCHLLLRPRRPRTLSGRLQVAGGAIIMALAVSAITGGRWSWLLGGAAALIVFLALVPRLTGMVKPVGAYVGVWLVFNLLRTWADDTAWADQVLGLVPQLEARLFGGQLPSAVLQTGSYAPDQLAWYDYAWTVVYLSFFVAPHLAAVLLLWRSWPVFWHYVVATAVLFALALVGFLAIPTSPPWLVTETVTGGQFAEIQRVTEVVLRDLNLPFRLFNYGQGEAAHISEVRIEPNPIAAMPSIHFAATALLVFPVRRAGVPVAGAMVLYACLMAIALVYLGEHYVLDIVVGGTLAALAWWITGRCFAATADTAHESDR